MSSTPKPDEEESEYIDRMLGKPGSAERQAGDPSAVDYYRMIWRAAQRSQASNQGVDRQRQ